MESGDIKIALKNIGSWIGKFMRDEESRWFKVSSISFAAHLILMPLIFFFIMRFEKPEEVQPVFMLSGGLHVNEIESEDEELSADELALLDDEMEDEDLDEDEDDDDWDEDEDMDIEKEVLERLTEEKEDIFSPIPAYDSPGTYYWSEDDEEEEEEDEDWEAVLDEEAEKEDEEVEVEIIDEFAESDTGEEEEGEEEEAEDGEKEIKIAKKWDDIFAKKVKTEKEVRKSKADEKIESLMQINPYSDDSEHALTGKNLVAGSFFGEGEAQLPDLLLWLPSDIKMAGLVSLSLLRSRSDREVFEDTFTKLPYFDSIAGGSDMDFFQQIDSILIATYNPFEVEETYLMLRHNQDEKMIRKAVSRHFAALGVKANWYKISGKDVVQPSKKYFDKIPWIYFFPRDKIVGVVHISKRDSIKTLMETPSSAENSGVHLVGPLERLMRFGYGMPEAAEEEGQKLPPGIVVGSVQFDELMAVLNKGGKFPLPAETMIIGRFGQENISVEGTALFQEKQDTQKFISQWQSTLEPIRKHKIIKILGIDKILDFPVWKQGENGNLTLQALVPPDRVEPLLALIRLITGGEKKTQEKQKPPKKKKQ